MVRHTKIESQDRPSRRHCVLRPHCDRHSWARILVVILCVIMYMGTDLTLASAQASPSTKSCKLNGFETLVGLAFQPVSIAGRFVVAALGLILWLPTQDRYLLDSSGLFDPWWPEPLKVCLAGSDASD